MKGLRAYVADEWAIICAQLLHHLRYPSNIVIAAANESDQCFPGILLQDTNSCKFRCLLFEIGIRCCPFFVQLAQIRLQIEVMLNKFEGVIGVWSRRFGRGGRSRRRRGQKDFGMPRKYSAIVEVLGVLPQREDSAMEGARPFVLGRLAPSIERTLSARYEIQVYMCLT